jgi:hypothetical protein
MLRSIQQSKPNKQENTMNTQIIAQLFAEAAIEAGLTAEKQELIARRLNEACMEFAEETDINYHDDYHFMSAANQR